MTYEEDGYCALVPISSRTSLTYLIFVKPFDGLTWMFLAISIVSCVAIFWMFRFRGAVDSPWLFGYGMFVYFIGQGVDFSRRNRPVLTILIQLIILMIFILSNAYEGGIISFMIQPMQKNRLKTVDDLIASDYEILTDEVFEFKVKEDDRFNALKSRMEIVKKLDLDVYLKEFMRQHYVFVKNCDLAEVELQYLLPNGQRSRNYYYFLPEKILWHYVQLEASYMNPYLERFHYYMDLCFQAGLPHAWRIVVAQDFYKKFSIVYSNKVEYLHLKIFIKSLV
ncbi:hypothetical protein ACKWTF_015828 [Chironomus riparius]